MNTIVDFALEAYGKRVVKQAKKLGRGTEMANSLKFSHTANSIKFSVVDYGIYQNSGVKGSVSTIPIVGKTQREAIRLGIATRQFKYTKKKPPAGAFARGGGNGFGAALTVFRYGFPSSKAYLRWLSKPINDANNDFENLVPDEMWEDLIFNEA